MTDRPIIMSGPMVVALLEGRKTQTRRKAWSEPRRGEMSRMNTKLPRGSPVATTWQRVCPGDRLWVRETWGIDQRGDATPAGKPYDPLTLYRESDTEPEPANRQWEPFRWRRSIHMPRWASRLTLIVTETRVERLQEIDGIAALAEGITRQEGVAPWRVYMRLWNSLHGPGAWESNPEVCVLTFTVHQCNIDQMGEAA